MGYNEPKNIARILHIKKNYAILFGSGRQTRSNKTRLHKAQHDRHWKGMEKKILTLVLESWLVGMAAGTGQQARNHNTNQLLKKIQVAQVVDACLMSFHARLNGLGDLVCLGTAVKSRNLDVMSIRNKELQKPKTENSNKF